MTNDVFKLSKKRHGLREVDLESNVPDKNTYESRKKKLQTELLAIQQAFLLQKRRAVLLFEGWDAAGKGGAIRRLTQGLDPRSYKVWPIAAPSEEEKGMHYLDRFWRRLAPPGTLALFDRSWYGRVLVERVEELVPKPTWKRAYREINEFERMLSDDGMPVIKLFFHISPEVQLQRLEERLTDPVKRWKISADDFRNRARWKDYVKAIDEMLDRTWTQTAPWNLISSDHKWFGRLQTMEVVVERLKPVIDLTPARIDPEIEGLLQQARRRGADKP